MAVDPAVNARIERIARAQEGVIRWEQLREAGLTPAAVKARVARGALHRRYRGVYTVADPSLLPFAEHSAALLSFSGDAVLSHRTAAALWSLAKADDDPIHVTVVGGKPRPRARVHIHRVRALHPLDTTTKQNLRLTTPARTVIDFATDATAAELEHAVAEGRALKLFTDRRLEQALDRVPDNHTGAAAVKALLRTEHGRALTHSERERKLLKLINQAQLPPPLANATVHGFKVDLYWPAHRLVVEFDGFGFHGSRRKFEHDRRRDQTLAAAGIQVIRVTWLQLEREPTAVIARIAQAMVLRAA